MLAAALALCALGVCAVGLRRHGRRHDPAFADPAKYELYDCKQLEAERKSLASRAAELQGLMAKAETGVGGAVVSELAYRNDYVAVRGQTRLAEEAWRKNRCREGSPHRRHHRRTRPTQAGAAVEIRQRGVLNPVTRLVAVAAA